MLIWSIGFYTINAFVHFDFLDNIMSPVSIALLNTVFRLVTVCVLFPFINKLEKLVCWLVKDSAEELEDETALRVYEGTPAGTVFSEPIKIAFKDVYGTELGDLTLMYKEGDNWVEDTKGGSVTTGASTYTMNVKHFSTFKADAKMTTVEAPSTTDVDTKTIEVNKKNDADDKITVKVKMQAVIGTEFETSIVDAVKKAGFTNTMAIQKIAEMVESRLLALGLSNTGITEYEQTQDFEIAGRTAFVSYDRARTYKLESFTFTVNGKNVVINTKTAVKTELTNPILTYYGHGHTHGGDNLSGGGIIDAE